ncbi:MAG: type II toxin-antitoxin system VapC family toxin [Bacillota bacterium]
MVLLDTDVMVDILRGYPSALSWLESLDDEEIGLPGFVVMELIQGCRNKKEQQLVENVLAGYRILWPSPQDCDKALAVFASAHLTSKLGILDVLIGHTAVGLGEPLCTFNVKHYAAIPGLKTTQPYAR